MDNVLNRPLFRHREARDRLNESVGVQRFQEGGIVSGAGNPDFGGGSRAPVNMTADPSGAITRQYRQQNIRPVGLASLPSSSAAENLYNLRGFQLANNELLAAEDEVKLMQERFADDPTGENQQAYLDALADLEAQRQKTEAVRESFVPGPLGPISDTRGTLAVEGPEAMVSQMSPEQLDIFNNLDRAAEKPAPDVVPRGPSGMETEARDRGLVSPRPLGPSGMEMEARGRGVQDEAPAGRSTMEADARDRGPLVTNPADVAAGLNAPDPAVREKTVTDFMKEYTDAAPKYEGADKGLLLAQIGFAIAAGESPNAMQNIANGLLAGSDMMLKDKAAKDEFNRQVQLSAMQYGFGEAASQRALERQFTDYVASRDVTYRGKKYGPNESVPVLHSDIIGGRMPEGVITEGSSDALIAADAAVRKSMAEALKEQTLTPAAYQEAINTLDTAASDYSSARNLMPLLEASLVRVAGGEVTGIDAALTRKMNEVMNAVGLKPESEYESPEAFESALRQVSVTMVQDLLGESGKTISDADRRLIDGLIGLQQDVVSGIVKDPDILTRKVQELMRVLEGKQRNALDAYTTAMEGYGGTYTPSGTPLRSLRAERVFNEEAAAPAIQYEWDQANNRLVLKKSGG